MIFLLLALVVVGVYVAVALYVDRPTGHASPPHGWPGDEDDDEDDAA